MEPHARFLLHAARTHLRPIGVIQKGKSRTWLDDRGWFVTVVEFQPSGFSKGSYLNVGAHFLWTWTDSLSFDLGHRIDHFVDYESEEQFAAEADRLAKRAAQEVLAIRERLRSPTALTAVLDARPGGKGWLEYHAAVALGLSGRSEEAQARFLYLADLAADDDREWVREKRERCRQFASLVTDSPGFVDMISDLIRQHRAQLKLPEVNDPIFG